MVQTNTPPEMETVMEYVDCREDMVPTREGSTRINIISPRTDEENYPLFINIHGGGFVRGHNRRDILFSAFLAHRLDCKVIDIDYRLAPEHPFPTALNECYDVTKWAFDNADILKVDKNRIALGGHSAGGNFTAAIALMANQTKDFSICLQVMDYPFLDGVTDPAEKVDEHSLLPVERMRSFSELYMGEEDHSNPFFSLVCATPDMLEGLPPALIITAGKDCLKEEAEKYGLMLINAGVEVKMRCFLESDHGFIVHCLAEYKEAQNLIINALSEAFR